MRKKWQNFLIDQQIASPLSNPDFLKNKQHEAHVSPLNKYDLLILKSVVIFDESLWQSIDLIKRNR